jgi:hypothetical protein
MAAVIQLPLNFVRQGVFTTIAIDERRAIEPSARCRPESRCTVTAVPWQPNIVLYSYIAAVQVVELSLLLREHQMTLSVYEMHRWFK